MGVKSKTGENMNQTLKLESVFRAEQVRLKPYYDLTSYRRELLYAQDVIGIHIDRVEAWMEDNSIGRENFNTEFQENIRGIVEQGETRQEEARRDTLIAFYAESIGKFPDPGARATFTKCIIAALDDGGELNHGDVYHNEFIAAIRERQEVEGDGRR